MVLGKYSQIAERIAVVDVETTGLYPADRIVEIGIVTLDHHGQVIDEWETLVNPQRDVGPTWIHGITAAMVQTAPTFEQVADQVAARIHGAIVCSHNLMFDARMLYQEYERIGADMTLATGLCTLRVTGGRLGWECECRGIVHAGPHRAIEDARATSQLLLHVVDALPAAVVPARVEATGLPEVEAVVRTGAPAPAVDPPFLAAVIATMKHQATPAAIAEYVHMLDLAMADLHVDAEEREHLSQLADEFGLSPGAVDRSHRHWLDDLIETATADGIVDDDEFDQLLRAAHVLGLSTDYVLDRTAQERSRPVDVEITPGMGITFTGLSDEDPIIRHTRGLGLKHEPNFTKSRTDIVVAYDPATDSSKARKARAAGKPIVSLDAFLDIVSTGAVVPGTITIGNTRGTVECATCGRAFTRTKTRSRKPAHCEGCTPET